MENTQNPMAPSQGGQANPPLEPLAKQKHLPGKIWVTVLILMVLVAGYMVWRTRYRFASLFPTDSYSTYTECTEKTKLPCKHYFVGDLGQEWRPSPYRSKGECEEKQGRPCLVPPGEFYEQRWIPDTDLLTAEREKTKTWKIYRNEEFGFEVKYPEDWKIIWDARTEVKFASEWRIQATSENDKNCQDNDNDTICATEFLSSDVSVNLHKGPSDIPKGEMKWINGIFWNRSEEEGLYLYITYDTQNNDDTIVFSTVNSGEDELLKILSTFRFLESQIDTSNWKTYRNEEFGFEVKYPDELTAIFDKPYTATAYSDTFIFIRVLEINRLGEPVGPVEFSIDIIKKGSFDEGLESIRREEKNGIYRYVGSYKRNGIQGYRYENLSDPMGSGQKPEKIGEFIIFKHPKLPSNFYGFISVSKGSYLDKLDLFLKNLKF